MNEAVRERSVNSSRVLNRRVGYVAIIVFILLLTFVMSALASASLVTERSIEPSSSSVSATNVTYGVNFTSVDAANAFVIDFCSNTPLIGQTCTSPTGFDVSAADATTTGFTEEQALDNNTLRITGSIAATTAVSVNVTGIVNPSVAGPMYARIVTYDSDTNADTYQSDDLGSGVVDSGSVAMSITPTIGVSGSVLESMTFCVAKNMISANCDLTDNQPPAIKLGEVVGDNTVLSTDVSEGIIYTQISTNAVSGAVVSLKSGATGCGGLRRMGAPSACDIAPAQTSGISPGEAKFGVKLVPAANTGSNPGGILRAINNYNDSTFTLNYTVGDTAGVTGAYGDPFFDTNGGPANGKNMALTFGAAISQTTPAGSYSTDLSLIATGRF